MNSKRSNQASQTTDLAAPKRRRRPLRKPHVFVPGTPQQNTQESPEERIEPDARTKRAASKKQHPFDAVRSFAANHRLGVIVVLVLVAVVWTLYPPLKELYAAKRDCAIREAVLEQIKASNEEQEAEIARLQTPEGIKDEARARGWVDEGEVSVVVEGLEATDSDTHEDPGQNTKDNKPQTKGDAQQKDDTAQSKEQESKLTEKQQKAIQKRSEIGKVYQVETPWWAQILDKIFFYTPIEIKAAQ